MNDDPANGPADGSPTLRPVKALRFVALIAIAAVCIAATGVTARRKDEEKLARWTVEQAIPDVAVVKPKPETASKGFVLPGNVEAFYSDSIHGQVSGYVREWRTDIGAKVKRGQTLAVIDTPEVDERVTAAQGELAKAKARQQMAHVTAQRWGTLRSSAAVSQQAIDEKDSDAHATDAEVSAAEANLERLQALKGFANIAAPFDGIVTARNVDIGSLVTTSSAMSEPLFVVADLSRMRVYVRAPEVYAAKLHDGMTATLTLPEYPDRSFPARIATTSDAIDPKSRSLLVELLADNKQGLLKPGAFAQVTFELPPNPDTLTLPASALLFRDESILVATVDSQSHIELKKIRIARDYGSRVEIEGHVSADDEVVRNPLESLAQGDEVRVVRVGAGKTIENAKANAKLAEDAAK
jgi:RND family efflux transporter MFP subunit